MKFEPTPISARCAYAMSVVTRDISPALSFDYLCVAIECAFTAGIYAESGRLPLVLADVEVLRTAYMDGMDSFADLPSGEHLVFQSAWKFHEDTHRTRHVVIEVGEDGPYRVEVEVVFAGGDRERVVLGHFLSQESAVEQGARHELVWHDLPEPTEVEVINFKRNLSHVSAQLDELAFAA